MIFSNVASELWRAADALGDGRAEGFRADMHSFSKRVLDNFVDENFSIHEVIKRDGGFFGGLLGEYANPGHTLEDMWFALEAADASGDTEMAQKAAKAAKRAFQIGWDKEYGGILHFASVNGVAPEEPGRRCSRMSPR